jgi:fructokinase
MKGQIVCFGETLWDLLPGGRVPGGAPMNVAIHLKYHGIEPLMISRVGTDAFGEDLLDVLRQKAVSVQWIQTDSAHPTGTVHADVTNKTDVTYRIVEDVAWDYITFDPLVAEKVQQADFFVYGSLAARTRTSAASLLRYLPLARQRVFDVNLRPPHYTPARLEELLRYADILKMNHHELEEISAWYGGSGDQQHLMNFLRNYFGLQLVLVTRGERGAAALSGDGFAEHPGFAVEVEDTIGSGDSFLAAFLSNLLLLQPVPVCLERACRVGAFVATKKGATPFYDPEKVNDLV